MRCMAELTIDTVLTHYGAREVPQGVGWRPMKCPFHNDAHASASVNHDEQGAFKCHTCGVQGPPLKIIETQERLSREAAIEFAGTILGASVPELPRTNGRSKKRRPMGRERWSKVFE